MSLVVGDRIRFLGGDFAAAIKGYTGVVTERLEPIRNQEALYRDVVWSVKLDQVRAEYEGRPGQGGYDAAVPIEHIGTVEILERPSDLDCVALYEQLRVLDP